MSYNGMMRTCSCGSGKFGRWVHDARGIPLAKTCDDCHEFKMLGFRPEVLTNPNYSHDEPIEADLT